MAGGYGGSQYLAIRGTGEINVANSATQGPDIKCKAVMFKAREANTGQIYVGYTSGVTVVDSATDATTGFELGAGDDTGYLPTGGNLNKFYFIASVNGEDLTYVALS